MIQLYVVIVVKVAVGSRLVLIVIKKSVPTVFEDEHVCGDDDGGTAGGMKDGIGKVAKLPVTEPVDE